MPDQAAGDPLDLLADYLAGRHLLLILDTCEHLIDGCAILGEVLLRAAPRLRILATSREPLEVTGEQAFVIPPLAVPDPGAPADGSEAVALFVDRAEAIVPGFALTAANERAIAQLCRALDGIPLALELAAVRLRTMSIEQVVDRIDDRFRFLGPTRSTMNRHQTLRAAIDWSHELCTAGERLLWARLSVFPGDFDLAAAEKVGIGDELSADDLLDTLGRLVEKSIVLCEQDGRRYRMLDTIREYGAERLSVLGGREELCHRHRDHYLGLTEQAMAGSLGARQVEWLSRLRQETHNLRVALDYSYARPGQEETGLRMTVLLRQYWLMVGLFTEGRRWHDKARALAADSADAAWAVYGAAVLALQQGDQESARPLLVQADGLAGKLGDADLAAHVKEAWGIERFHEGDLEGARDCHESALASYTELGYSEPFALISAVRLASVCCLTGELDRAISLSEDCLRRCTDLGEQWGRGAALWIRGATRWLSGDAVRAIEDARACLRIKESLGDLYWITTSIDLVAVCLVAQSDYERGAQLSGAGDSLWQILGAPVQQGPYYAEIRRDAAETCRRELGDDRFRAAHQRGMELPVADVIALARGETAPSGTGSIGVLTKRELEVAALVADGLGNREIAERLVLSKRTIDAHIDHIFAKLGFSSRAQVAVWFSRQPGT
jgi:non-specific serine/threonine protein kinase